MILELLKARTRAHHERAEAALPLMDDGLTLERYRDTLAAFLGVYLPMEERLGALHAWHALGLLGVGLLITQFPNTRGLKVTAWLFVAGIVLFCGSLYALALGASRAAGVVTPFGGVAFIAGWLLLAWTARSATRD